MILFGTGGIRGKMRLGEFDETLVMRASEAVSRWIRDNGGKTVVIAYDTRRNSDRFARLAASIFSRNGLEAFVFDRPMPTPLLSFAVRYMEADAGVVITASHNPPEYNGYKVYTSNGVQALPHDTAKITEYLSKIEEVQPLSGTERIRNVPGEVVEAYAKAVLSLMEEYGFERSPKLVYTPLHGAGFGVVDALLKEMGVDLRLVDEQTVWDGSFATTPSPNPENEEALKLLMEEMSKEGIPYGIATDPDTDRVGFVVMDGNEPKRLTGNQVGVLLTDLSIRMRKLEEPYVVKTIVSTEMVRPLCEKHGVEVYETPTGFKYIGDLIHRREKAGDKGFLFAFEESCGYLAGDFVKDKDGVIGSCLLASLASRDGVLERLEELYKELGYYFERLINVELGSEEVARRLYDTLKRIPPEMIGTIRVNDFRDYSKDPGDVVPNETLLFETEIGKVFIRPSGTEPKLKLYVMVEGENEHDALKRIDSLSDAARRAVRSLMGVIEQG